MIDYSGGREVGEGVSEEQLKGAVAIHNMLVEHKVAYLADEVGMGKTYVALGAAALFRHFTPGWRVLYITPRENIQDKWRKELLNFTAKNWKVLDNRVKSFQRTPAYSLRFCSNLVSLAHESTINNQADFLVRMTSFSLGLSLRDPQQWKWRRDELLENIPWLDASLFDLRGDKEEFKVNYARALNLILPQFDLVVVDEAHNLKHGLIESAATRNRLIAAVLGHPEFADEQHFPGYGKRFERALLLSATPLETNYAELWNQLDIFDCGKDLSSLCDSSLGDEQKEEIARRFLIRRMTGLTIGGKLYTKNMYRREWRNGGVAEHDDPLRVADERQRLVVGLVQKKVAEVIGTDRFNHSFQIGMLASFESFMETTRAKKSTDEDDETTFAESYQTERKAEKEGIDTPSINSLARTYRREFGTPLPHPKMDSVVERLRRSIATGEKALVFVRRIKSVDEMVEKVNFAYDDWLLEDIHARLPESIQGDFGRAVSLYREEKQTRRLRREQRYEPKDQADEEDESLIFKDEDDEGDIDNFFAWFFRGEGPDGFLSGAAFNKNRLSSEGSFYSVFFEDNYLADLLGFPDNMLHSLSQCLGKDLKSTEESLRHQAYAHFRFRSKSKSFPRLRVYAAYQEAGLSLITHLAADEELRSRAQIVLRERFGGRTPDPLTPTANFPDHAEYLSAETFFTMLRKRPSLLDSLWPQDQQERYGDYFRRKEQRRELLLASARLGHGMIDLWLLFVQRLQSLSLRGQDRAEGAVKTLIEDYLDLLARQAEATWGRFNTFHELSQISSNFDLITAVNFPEMREMSLNDLALFLGRALARQSPVAGMSEGVNKNVVRQFLMPGYPLVIVTTDVLREGADLHTFCKDVYHYGISWTPSSMEQRTGRVDRIRSLAQRTLDKRESVTGDELLQVYYPHLKDTVERIQVERVYERLNKFVRMLHKQLSGEQIQGSSSINMARDILFHRTDIKPIVGPLKSSFEVKDEDLHNELPLKLPAGVDVSTRLILKFKSLIFQLLEGWESESEVSRDEWKFVGTFFIDETPSIVLKGKRAKTNRIQPASIFVQSGTGDGRVFLRCVSPVGAVDLEDRWVLSQLEGFQGKLSPARICTASRDRLGGCNLTIESDHLFNLDSTTLDDMKAMVVAATIAADALEELLLGVDKLIDDYHGNLDRGSEDAEVQ